MGERINGLPPARPGNEVLPAVPFDHAATLTVAAKSVEKQARSYPAGGPRERITPAITALRQEAEVRTTRASVAVSDRIERHDGQVQSDQHVTVQNREELARLLGGADSMRVTDLTLAGGTFTDDDLRNLPSGLKRLNLSGNDWITDVGVGHLAQLPLHDLSLGSCVAVTNGALVSLKNMPLHALDLHGCERIDERGMVHLKRLPLEQLDISWCGPMSDRALDPLAALALRDLNLIKSTISGNGMANFVNMPLERLHISSARNINNSAMQHLHGKPLQQLYMQNAALVGDSGFASLKGMPLNFLHMSGCRDLSDNGVAQLEGMPLRLLNLRGAARLTDGCIPVLMTLPLEQLCLRDCAGITSGGHARLAAHFPHLRYEA